MEFIDKCKYCSKETLIKCAECSHGFCNDISDGKSHIIYHLVKSKHKRISILDREIICAGCSENNLFRLGLAGNAKCEDELSGLLYKLNLNISKGDVTNESIDCHSTLKEEPNTAAETAGSSEAQETINENVKLTDESFDQNARFLDGYIKQLQNILANIYCGHCKDLPKLVGGKLISFYPSEKCAIELHDVKETDVSPKIRMHFTPESYLSTFIPLINAECRKEQEIKENMKQENMTLLIDGCYCKFIVQKSNSDFKVNVGDELKFSQRPGLSFVGYVCEEQFSDLIRVKIDVDSLPPGHTLDNIPRSGYTVEFIWNPTTYNRMKSALQSLYTKKKSNVIFKYILRGTKETMKEIEVFQPKKFSPLNQSQEIAVKAALTRTLTLIQGPPGTGKTMVSAVIVYNLVKHYGKKVLVVAPSNTAADQLAIKINDTGLKVLRIMSKRREDVSTDVDFLCLHKLLNEFFIDSKTTSQRNLLEMAEVVCCTCVTAGQKILKEFEFPFVLIDEAVQSTEPLSLVPCVYDPEKLILVGDHKQLGPTILNKDVVKYGFKQSLFERLLKIGVMPYLLSVQYRMHPDLCTFPSEYFYSGLLKSGTSTSKVLDLPNNFFYVCDGKEEISQSRTSFFNKSEAVIVENIIRFLFKNGVLEQQIGVITPYEGQRSYILGQIFGNEAGNLEIKNVDGFQGREKDFIIVSLVRSNIFQGVGFVGDKRRMNVTLTRAKHGLIIIGNPFTLYKNEMWADLLNWYDERGLVYEGPLNSLKRVSLKLLNLRGGISS